ncbi:sugar transferase [Pseudocnuella soli]|uniref:sugar transferase n=1 Tax=Pseudocnuella soli TaxID=2502779 RepID=UPI00140520B6|nr:sugar transferase [Pseudocnuella soli]
MIDILIAIFTILFLLCWLLPVLALFIKLDSRGPIFFIQRRVGYRGKKFACIKLRTMVVNSVADIKQAEENDRRITRIGRFLRKSNFDELPQFINVLMGDMSVVGPRPHMEKDCRDFQLVVPAYNNRHFVKPGITGLAQVRGFRGNTANIHDIIHRYRMDLFYVQKASLMFDISIISKTFTQTIMLALQQLRNREAMLAEEKKNSGALLPANIIVSNNGQHIFGNSNALHLHEKKELLNEFTFHQQLEKAG